MRFTIFVALVLGLGSGLMAQDDLAKFQEHMKAANAANMALRKAITDKDAAAVSANAGTMATNFEWIAGFFKDKGKADGEKFAKDASVASKAIADAKPDDQMAAAGKVAPNCQGCHGLYRAGSAFKGL
jgi:mono/diheme cytochrome c family protein